MGVVYEGKIVNKGFFFFFKLSKLLVQVIDVYYIG